MRSVDGRKRLDTINFRVKQSTEFSKIMEDTNEYRDLWEDVDAHADSPASYIWQTLGGINGRNFFPFKTPTETHVGNIQGKLCSYDGGGYVGTTNSFTIKEQLAPAVDGTERLGGRGCEGV